MDSDQLPGGMYKKFCSHLFVRQILTIHDVVQRDNLSVAAFVREVVDLGLHAYLQQKALVAPKGAKMFYCQACGQPTPMRRQHDIRVGPEVFLFCDGCVYSNKYKFTIVEFLKNQLI